MQICFQQAAGTAMLHIASLFLERAGTHMIADSHDQLCQFIATIWRGFLGIKVK